MNETLRSLGVSIQEGGRDTWDRMQWIDNGSNMLSVGQTKAYEAVQVNHGIVSVAWLWIIGFGIS